MKTQNTSIARIFRVSTSLSQVSVKDVKEKERGLCFRETRTQVLVPNLTPWASVLSQGDGRNSTCPSAVRGNETIPGNPLSRWLGHCRNLIFPCVSCLRYFPLVPQGLEALIFIEV